MAVSEVDTVPEDTVSHLRLKKNFECKAARKTEKVEPALRRMSRTGQYLDRHITVREWLIHGALPTGFSMAS